MKGSSTILFNETISSYTYDKINMIKGIEKVSIA